PGPAGRWPDGGLWPSGRVRGELALVGLTTSQASGVLMGYGTVGAAQLERLAAVLRDERLDGKLRVVILHPPPAGRHARSYRRGLRDAGAFAEVIQKHGAELILHGHEHLDLRNELPGPDGPVPVHGVQSGSYALHSPPRPAPHPVYTIQPGAPPPPAVRAGARPRRPAAADLA